MEKLNTVIKPQHEINRQKSLERVMKVIQLQYQGFTRKEACEKLGYRPDSTARAVQKFVRLGDKNVQAAVKHFSWR